MQIIWESVPKELVSRPVSDGHDVESPESSVLVSISPHDAADANTLSSVSIGLGQEDVTSAHYLAAASVQLGKS